MKRDIVIFLLACLIGLCAMECMSEGTKIQQTSTVAWWTLLYEQPNPEHLPVKVDFWWRNGG